MIFWFLVIVGGVTALLNGWNVAFAPSNWKSDMVWSAAGFGGIGLIVLALFLRKWGLA